MPATILEEPKTKMSVIFPTKPSQINIHLLPKNSKMISYSVTDCLTIKSWMPDGFNRFSQKVHETYDEFHENHCRSCDSYCRVDISDYEDENGEVDWDHPDLQYRCDVYDEGYEGVCVRGYQHEERHVEFDISEMVFCISLTHLGTKYYPTFNRINDSAYLCASQVEDGVIYVTEKYMASNVFGTDDYPEGICWGYNKSPQNLRGIVNSYFSTPFNNDLTPIDAFFENTQSVRSDSSEYRLEDEKIISTSSPDALILVDAEHDVSAFFQLLSAGYKPLPEAPHIMIIPLTETTITKNECSYSGYVTVNDDLGKQWFVTNDGLLIGQV